MTRVSADQSVKTWTDAEAIPTVTVINLNDSAGVQNVVLPGTVQAFNTAPIYARVSGYLKSWSADIGTPVKAGQDPGRDRNARPRPAQLAQAKANLNTAAANQHLSKITAVRWTGLFGPRTRCRSSPWTIRTATWRPRPRSPRIRAD